VGRDLGGVNAEQGVIGQVFDGLTTCIVDAKDDAARRFYERESLLPFPDQPQRLFRPMADIAKLYE
jgi:hypothetical protein